MTAPYRRIVLLGLSGTGKSTLGRLVSDRLGWSLIDTDSGIETSFGKMIPRIFAEDGEPVFRAAERSTLLGALERDDVVIATGAGAVVDESVWSSDLLSQPDTLTIGLHAPVPTLHARLVAQQAASGEAVERPMLAGSDPVGRMERLKEARAAAYARALLTLDVANVEPAHLAEEIAHLLSSGRDRGPSVVLELPGLTSAIHVESGIAGRAGELIGQRWPRAQRLWVVTDENVDHVHGDRFAETLGASGAMVHRRAVPPGESSKSWRVAGELVNWLVEGGLERSDVVVALGGGVVGDLAGFAAAVALRGVGLVQVPTTLLAMVDSSVGGKTGVNLPSGKNLAGAFYQPPLVLIDPAFLRTLPQRELTASWAEVVKHAIIQPSTPGGHRADLMPFLEQNGPALRSLREPALTHLIRRNVALKAVVVEADEREANLRAILNYGHTIGHGIEAAGYSYLHGEAIAVGMRAAGWIARELGRVDEATLARHGRLLDSFALPSRAPVDPALVIAKMRTDKKRAAGAQQWILAERKGGVSITADVPLELVEAAIRRHTNMAPTDSN